MTPLASVKTIAAILAEHLGLDPNRILSANLECRPGHFPTWKIRVASGPEAYEIARFGLVRVPPDAALEETE